MGTLTINNSACNVVIYPVEFGLMYNWYALSGTGNSSISSSDDWFIANNTQNTTMFGPFPNSDDESYKREEPTYWETGKGGNNFYGTNVSGTGIRLGVGGGGIFERFLTEVRYWAQSGYALTFEGTQITSYFGLESKRGCCVRLCKTTTDADGSVTQYIGNDGKLYQAKAFNGFYWLTNNLCETRFRNGNIIPWYGADPASYFTNAEWAALTTAGCCAYENNLSYVAPGFSFPT